VKLRGKLEQSGTTVTLNSGSGDETILLANAGVSAQATVTFPASTSSLSTLALAETLTNKTLTTPIISAPQLVDGSYKLTLSPSSTLTEDRALALNVNDGARSISLSGNISLGANLTTSHALTTTTGSVTLIGNASGSEVTLPASGTLATVSGTLTSPTLTTPDINGGTADSLTSLSIRDSSAAYDVTIAAASSPILDAGRTLTLNMANAARSVTLAGDLSLGANLSTTVGPVTLEAAGGETPGSSVTLPASGTLSTLAGTEELTNKTLTAALIKTSLDVNTAGNFTIAGSLGANTLTLGGGTSTVAVAGKLSSGNGIDLVEITTPVVAPASGFVRIYPKSDGKIYRQTSAGVETELGGSGGGSGDLLAANNLSDLISAATARTNLGLGTMATQAANAVAITGGTAAGLTSLGVSGDANVTGNYQINGVNFLMQRGTENVFGGGGGNTTQTGLRNVVFGPGAGVSLTNSNDNVLIGRNAGTLVSSGNGVNTIIGSSAGAALTAFIGCTLIGGSAGQSANAHQITAVGRSAGAVSGAGGTYIGWQAGTAVTGARNIGMGFDSLKSLTSGVDNIGIGYECAVNTNSLNVTLTVGRGATAHTSNTASFGSQTYPYNSFFLGSGEQSAAPTAVKLLAGGTSANDTAGADITIAGGIGRGTGTSGVIKFQTHAAGSSGSTQGTLVDRVTVGTDGVLTVGADATDAITGLSIRTSSGSSGRPEINFIRGGVARASLGAASANNDLLSGHSLTNDLVLRAEGANILIAPTPASGPALKLASTNDATFYGDAFINDLAGAAAIMAGPAFQYTTTTADTTALTDADWTNVGSISNITLTKGTWLVGYTLQLSVQKLSSAGEINGYACIYNTTSGAIVGGSTTKGGGYQATVTGATRHTLTVTVPLTVAATTEIKVMFRSDSTTVLSEVISRANSNDNGSAFFWAQKIKAAVS
jgi:hypothetical protein